jgi:hypothetical protein
MAVVPVVHLPQDGLMTSLKIDNGLPDPRASTYVLFVSVQRSVANRERR